MKKMFALPLFLGLTIFCSCEKEKSNPKTTLNGEWDVLEWGVTNISLQGDTTYINNEWDGLSEIQTVNTIANSYETINGIVSVNGIDYKLDEWELDPNDIDNIYDYWLWLEIVDTIDNCNHYYVLGKRD
ncbi:MAG: hypothetical protein FGM14_05850 [Flavobacteriales bacterium]|nr:hypothetical protein [Flavobacteriales bacterium]NBR15293.1 hypothetical protein [Crocinitomicaceae bacterium]NCA20005.1 hypothetical protein [Crocinitomicaceae bacterium]